MNNKYAYARWHIGDFIICVAFDTQQNMDDTSRMIK